MHQLLNAIDTSLEKQNWFGALFIALSIPDICGGAEGVIRGNGPRYRDWFDRYLKERYASESLYEQIRSSHPEQLVGISEKGLTYLKEAIPPVQFTADECWALRCACLHEGVDETKLRNFKLTPLSDPYLRTHLNIKDGLLQLEVQQLCQAIVKAAKKWMDDMQDRPEVVEKIEKMIRIEDIFLQDILP